MKLIVNGIAAYRSSFGVRRYYESVMQHINWPGEVQVTPMGRSKVIDRLSELCYPGQADAVLWSPSQRGPIRARHHVVTVHDCINVEYVYADDWRRPALQWTSQQLLGNAEAVVTISHATRAAVLRNYDVDPAKIVVIPSPSHVELPYEARQLEDGNQPVRPFVLMVTNALAHKNTELACRALIAADIRKRGIALHVVGALVPAAQGLCEDAKVDLTVSRGVSDQGLAKLYQQSLFLLSPSLEEGHNLPIAEAISLGANVLCSDIPVHREFYEGMVEFFPPTDEGALVDALDRAFARKGDWTPHRPPPKRSFADVAAAYSELFSSLYEKGGLVRPELLSQITELPQDMSKNENASTTPCAQAGRTSK